MGVDFTHCKARWSYSGFNSFRVALAQEIGVDLNTMQGFGGDIPWSTVDDPIVPLLNHSDCDGELSPEDCRAAAPRLRELIKPWEGLAYPRDYDYHNAIELAYGMELAAQSNNSLGFH